MQSLNTSALSILFRILISSSYRQKLLQPSLTIPDISYLDIRKLKQAGFKAIAFDKDNTITAPYSSDIHPPFLEKWKECKQEFGAHRMLIVSNSAGGPDDYPLYLQSFGIEQELGVRVLKHPDDKKPKGGEQLIKYFNLPANEIVFVGDRLLTDVVYANMIGAYSVWCTRIITTKGDNWFAAGIRRLEHWYYNIRNF
jgi:phosphatidylglycerophosphatase GEP4